MHPKPYSTIPSLAGQHFPSQRLVLHSALAHGTYGVVYSGSDTRTSTPIAVKVLRRVSPGKGGASRAARVRQEVRLHAALAEHPNVLGVHAAFDWDAFTLLVLDLCPAGTLYDYMDAARPYWRDGALVRRHFFQLLDAVAFCHARGVYHRDLKPQ